MKGFQKTTCKQTKTICFPFRARSSHWRGQSKLPKQLSKSLNNLLALCEYLRDCNCLWCALLQVTDFSFILRQALRIHRIYIFGLQNVFLYVQCIYAAFSCVVCILQKKTMFGNLYHVESLDVSPRIPIDFSQT